MKVIPTISHTNFALTAEMVENMKTVASTDQELSVEERNLLSVAYKNVIGARRASWRIVSSIEQKEESKGNEAQVTLIKEYRNKIEQELAKICDDILGVLDGSLIPAAGSGESKVFYYKMYVPLFPFIHSRRVFSARGYFAMSPSLFTRIACLSGYPGLSVSSVGHHLLVGREIITATSPNSPSETSAKIAPINPLRHTKQLLMSLSPNSHQHTLYVPSNLFFPEFQFSDFVA